MSSEAVRVKQHFERVAGAFDRIYQDERSLWKRFDRWRHRSMFERLRLTLEACGDVRGKRVLDVGCGSGRYAVALARRGAEVVGVDVSQPMLDVAAKAAAEAAVASRCQFLRGDILQLPLEGLFEISLAIGLFDYTSDPMPILTTMRRLTRGKLIASFPSRFHVLTPLRKLRLSLADCPVYFYTGSQIRRLLTWPGCRLIVRPLGRDVLAVVECAPTMESGEPPRA